MPSQSPEPKRSLSTSPPPKATRRSRSRSPRLDDDNIHPSRRRSPPRGDDNIHPSRRQRSRTRSRTPPRKPKSYSGLKWKKTERRDDAEQEDRGYRRGYRAQEEDRRRDEDRRRRDRSRERDDRFGGRGGGGRGGYGYDRRDDRDDRSGRRDREDRDRGYGGRDRDRDRFNDDRDWRNSDRDSDRPQSDRKSKEKRADKPKPTPTAAPANGEPMIIVTVNDRLGTKAQIPCLASDPVKMFKMMVAAKIGRQPYEIMLKRQGERPFKDFMTLADYGVSNGVQLDLELDTGD